MDRRHFIGQSAAALAKRAQTYKKQKLLSLVGAMVVLPLPSI